MTTDGGGSTPDVNDRLAQALAAAGLHPGAARSARPLPGHSHPVFDVAAGEERVAVKLRRADALPSPGAALATAEAARLGLGPAVLWSAPDGTALVTRWIDGYAPAGSAGWPVDLSQVLAGVGSLRRFHDGAAPLPGRIDPPAAIAALRGTFATAPWAHLLPTTARIASAWHALADSGPLVPSHGDAAPGNILVGPGGPRLIDWDHAGMAPRAWDLGYAAVEAGLDPLAAPGRLAAAYGSPVTGKAVSAAMLVAATMNLLWRAATPADIAAASPSLEKRLPALAALRAAGPTLLR